MKLPPEIQNLFDAYLDGELAEPDWLRLEAWLAEAPDHASTFLQWVALQVWTFEALRSQTLEQVMREPSHATLFEPSTEVADRESSEFHEPAAARNQQAALARSSFATALAIAATVLLLTWGGSFIASRFQGKQELPPVAARAEGKAYRDPEAALDVSDLNFAATLMQLDKCVWQNPKSSFSYGQPLGEGANVVLRSGTVRITFESGAQVLLEGPCDFTVDNAMHGTIRRGRLSATVPPRAVGFRIRSPDAEVIDLGTEFGVAVDRGHSEIHVFKGEVLSRQVNAQGDQHGELFHIATNDALRFGASPQPPRRISSNTSKFVGRNADQVTVGNKKQLPVDEDLALWLAADVAVKTERGQRVVAWPDIISGDNVTGEDALQPDKAAQPRLVPDAINRRPAIRFDGASTFLVTTPLETTDNQTILMVCQFNSHAARAGRKRGGQILNYNGPPHRLVSTAYEPGVLQIGEPIVDGFAATRLGGKLFAGRLSGRDVSESEIYTPPLGGNKPVVLSYCYDLGAHQASLWCNDGLVGQEPALRPAGVTSRKVIGRHGFMKYFFDGDLAELLIYNRALAPAELKQAMRYLSEKYQISFTNSSPAA